MVVTHARPKKKVSGGRYKKGKKKRLHEMGRIPSMTKVDERKVKKVRMRGKNLKIKLLSESTANVLDKKTKKFFKAKILSVSENPANRHYVRRNIMTKGTIIETEKGKAVVTSRPGQDGIVNAVLV
ncbi:30S ribosomal protein S8e [Candidatus Woesearchaeota archaeon]|nr:30S ribosomal protein S8e [Candidatus Woesearchaeota archaeon]